ncbi:MAG TPA: helix-turn-helix transcriptional regulator [Conexibacter sp.]|nr:helix-turn-helix transcriptional regulator [Conexibacter sp.]
MKQMDITAPASDDRDRNWIKQESTTRRGRQDVDRPLPAVFDDVNVVNDVNVVAKPPAATEGGAVPDVSRFLTALGQALRERREELQLTQEAVSLLTGVPQRRIWEIEAGIGNPTARTLLRLVSGLNTPCSAIFARAEELAAQPPASDADG